MMQRLQLLGRGQRLFVFVMIFGGGLFLIVAIVAFLILFTVNSQPRQEPQPVAENITVASFVELPDDDSYPATVTVDSAGVVYTGSYASGAVWSITPDGTLSELPQTRELIGSVAALAIAPDGSLYVLDRLDSDPRAAGGMIWRIADGNTAEFGTIDDVTGFVSAHDIAIDAAGNVYASDRGRREVWRFSPDGVGEPFWQVPLDDPLVNEVTPTGLAYDPATDSLLVTDINTDTLYRVSLDGETTGILYRYPDDAPANDRPAFDGISITPDGTVYIAAFRSGNQNGVIRLDGDTLTYLADNFRGASDVAVSGNRIYVTNFDSRSLVLPGVDPQLPFSIDVVTLPE